jgi:hypothetical protein
MGCLKLTYDYQEQGEKNDSLKWSVWVNPESDFLGVVDHQTQGGPADDLIKQYERNQAKAPLVVAGRYHCNFNLLLRVA